MKNIKSNTAKAILLVIAFMMVSPSFYAQKPALSFALNYRISGNGLGSVVIPQVGLQGKKHEVMVGTNIQKRNHNVSGLDVRYNYNLVKAGNAEFFLFCDANYLSNGYLGKCLVKMESFAKPENSQFYQTVRMNVMETHAGFGVKFLKSNNFNCFALVGAGAYKTVGCYSANLFRIRDCAGSSLLLGVGLNIKINSTHKQ